MNKFFVGCIVMLSIPLFSSAQYYYKDIVINRQANEDMARYREAKIRSIKIKSIESDGQPSEGFFCEKKISKDFKTTSLYTRTSQSGTSLLESYFNEAGKLIRNYDSSEINITNTYFSYNEAGKLTKILSISQSKDDDYINQLEEEHLYTYNGENLEKMTRVKNKKDSTEILFSLDENNNVILEKDSKTAAKYYYYYDDKKRLTDVAHANEFRQKMVADYVLEYNGDGQITSMTVTEEGGNSYFVWKYNYENNLRTRERIFSDERKLMGTIEYEYK